MPDHLSPLDDPRIIKDRSTGEFTPEFIEAITAEYEQACVTDGPRSSTQDIRDRITTRIDMAMRDDLEAGTRTPLEGTNEDRLRYALCARITEEIRDFSQVEAAAWLGISQAKVSSILTGKTAGVLSLSRLLSILDDLGIVLRV